MAVQPVNVGRVSTQMIVGPPPAPRIGAVFAQILVGPDTGTNVDLGLVSETTTAHALTALVGKVVALGIVTESTTVHALTATVGQVVALGVVSETTTAHAITITGDVSISLGVVSESTTVHALSLTQGSVISLGVVTETTTVHAVSAVSPTVVTLGVVTETTFVRALTVDTGYTDTARNWTSGRQRDGIATWSWSPAVVDYPAHLSPAAAWVTAIAFDPPTIVNGRPIVSVTTETEVKTRHRITIGGVDVNFLRGVPTPEMDYQLLEPGMYGPGSLLLPQVYGYMEEPGEGDLAFLYKHAPVEQHQVDDEGNVVSTDYKGLVISWDITDDGFRIETGGELTGRLALTEKQIPLYRNVYDLGRQVALMVKNHGAPFQPVGGPDTGIETAGEGGTGYLDAFNRLNALGVTKTGAQYSTMPDENGIYRFERKDLTTIHATCYAHDGQLPANLRRDFSEEQNRFYGTGVTPSGMRVLNAVYPDLALQNAVPDYPKAGGSAFGVGTTDAETINGDGITVMVNALHRNGFLDAADAAGGYDDDVADAIQEVQRRAGLSISLTGDMNQATWRALFDQDANGYSMRGSTILPMAQDPATNRWRRGASGAIIGRNHAYDPSVVPVDRSVDFGTGFRKPQMLRWAKRELAESDAPNWVGTITVETGALIAGDHTPGDPITEIIPATSIKPGMNVSLPLFMGGVVVHVSGVSVSGGRVTLSVDTRARDTIAVWEVIRRNRESRRNPHRAWIRSHLSSGNISDAITEWSEAGGKINDVDLPGGQWTAFPVVVGRSGTVGRLKIRTQAPTEFWMCVLGQGDKEHIERKLERRIGDPSTEGGAENWVDEDVLDTLDRENLLLYVAGTPEAPCGYWPAPVESIGEGSAFLTGKWQANAGFEYRTGPANIIWVAVFPANTTKIPGGRIMYPKLEPM